MFSAASALRSGLKLLVSTPFRAAGTPTRVHFGGTKLHNLRLLEMFLKDFK